MAGFAVFLYLLFSLLPLVSPEAIYYITPSPESPCRHTDCYTLSEVLEDIDRYFDTSTKLVFLAGKHTLDTGTVFLENLGSVVWQGNTVLLPNLTSTVECSQSSAIVFVNVSKVQINALTFSSCGDHNTSMILSDITGTYLPTITAMFIPVLLVHSCVIQYSHLPLFLFESTLDCHNCSFEYNQGENGGAILAYSSNATFLGETVLHGNNASSDGGGLYMVNSVLVLQGITHFTNNTASVGGAISAYMSHINFKISGNAEQSENEHWFVENFSLYGGGVALEQCTLTTSNGVKLFFSSNFANGFGGGLWSAASSIIVSSNVTFQNGTALLGGGMYLNQSSWVSNLLLCTHNFATGGGGIYSLNSSLCLEQNSCFVQNSLQRSSELNLKVNITSSNWDEQELGIDYLKGGGIATRESNVTFYSTATFINNTANSGGAIYSSYSIIEFLSCESVEHNQTSSRFDDYKFGLLNSSLSCTHFEQNSAYLGGAIKTYISTITFMGQTIFKQNSADSGGGITVDGHSEVNFEGKTVFMENSANYGGGLSCGIKSIVTFSGSGNMFFGNRADYSGGGIDMVTDSTVYLVGNGCFVNNSGGRSGGAIAASKSEITLTGNFSFSNNTAYYGGAVSIVQNSNVTLNGRHNFIGNTAENKLLRGYGGGLYAHGSRLTFSGQQSFINNSASNGGALAIAQIDPGKGLYLAVNTFVYFISNYAWHKGGAVIVQDKSITFCPNNPPDNLFDQPHCFIHFEGRLLNNCSTLFEYVSDNIANIFLNQNSHIIFENNLSEQGGDSLYGGDFEGCSVYRTSPKGSYIGTIALPYLTGVPLKQYSGKPLISSDPYCVCICNNFQPNCSIMSLNYSLYPGETVYITVAAVGQIEGTVSAVVHCQLENVQNTRVDPLQTTQQVNKTCSTLQYRVTKGTSARSNEVNMLTLYVEGSCRSLGKDISVYITLLPCPRGFSLSQSGVCICEKRLKKFTNSCDITNRSISHTGNFWVGYDKQSHGLILHPHCPFDYCGLEAVSFTLNSTDMQCAHSRSGVLCGSCKPGLSLNLGSSRCSNCPNSHVFIFFITALAGFLLVIFIFIFRVTVTDGTTSGLIFYANVILVNRNIFYPSTTTNVLTVFIAWLNLDLGIETCLFHGMDAYIRTWLQFVFPLYIWLLVGLITLASRYSMTVAKIIGPTNPVSVLATLFLLSYTKLLRTIIATLAFTTLEYPDDKSVVVWVYDGNIPYLEGKHIPLFIVGVLSSIFLFLPYTLLLLFGQCILAASNHRLVSWATNPKVRFFLDTYHAPYKNRHRYWVGLLLLLRFIVFIISVTVDINAPRDPSTNLLVLIITCAGLLILTTNSESVYKKRYNTILESSFILNLTILAAVSYQVKVEGGTRNVAVYLSMTVALITFLGIITYHVSQQLASTRIWRHSIKPALYRLRLQLFHRSHHEEDPPVELAAPPVAQPQPVPTTFIELREPLLESQQ